MNKALRPLRMQFFLEACQLPKKAPIMLEPVNVSVCGQLPIYWKF